MVAWKVWFSDCSWDSLKPWTKLIVQKQEHFWLFLKVLEEKLMPHSQISFKSWFENKDSDFKKHFVKLMLFSIEKKVFFQMAFASPAPWTNLIVKIPGSFPQFSKVPEKIWCHILISVLKVSLKMWTQNYENVFKIEDLVSWRKKVVLKWPLVFLQWQWQWLVA